MVSKTGMRKKTKILVVAASLAAVLALSIGGVAAAASARSANGQAPQAGQSAGFGQGSCSEAVRDLLGLTTGEIQTMRHQGMSLVQIAATKGVTEQQLVDVVMAQRDAVVQARVVAGTLTQAQANVMLQDMEQNVTRAITRTTVGQPEWAGTGGFGLGAGNGQSAAHAQSAGGAGYGESGLGTGPGNAHQWGKASH